MAVEVKRRAGRPSREDTRRKSERLLEAATGLFVARGFDGTTMEAIAHAAHMGKQAVYMRFPDKESVFAAVIQRLKDRETHEPFTIEETQPLAEALPRNIQKVMAAAASPTARLITHLAFREGHRFPALIGVLAEATEQHYIRPLARSIDRAVAAGEARPIDSFTAASICVDVIVSEVLRAELLQTPLMPAQIEQKSAEVADLMLSGLLKRR